METLHSFKKEASYRHVICRFLQGFFFIQGPPRLNSRKDQNIQKNVFRNYRLRILEVMMCEIGTQVYWKSTFHYYISGFFFFVPRLGNHACNCNEEKFLGKNIDKQIVFIAIYYLWTIDIKQTCLIQFIPPFK